VSEWEKNTFEEYCGSGPESRPERLKQMFSQQQAFERGRRENSPLISWEDYQAKLAQFIADFNQTPHERTNLDGGSTVIPHDEYLRLYRTRYDISPETIFLLLTKTDGRVLQKNGVNCFKRGWYYWCDEMSQYKDEKERIKVEIRYTDRDYSRIWVVLPDKKPYEARLIKGSPLINPNKETLQTVARARAQERKVIRDFELLAQAMWREETPEERLNRQLSIEPATTLDAPITEQERIERVTRFASGAGMMEPDSNQAVLKNLTELDTPEISTVIVRRSRQVWVNEVDNE
jgi:hypothetical protein